MKNCKLKILNEIEVKFENVDVITRRKMVDACKYFLPHARYLPAYKLGRWDGMKHFCDVGGRSYMHMLDRLLPIVYDAGYDVEVEDLRPNYGFEFEQIDENFFSYAAWPEGHPHAGKPIELKEHQVRACNTFLENLQSIGVLATGAGKSILTAALSKQVEKYGRSIIIVPNKDLVVQTERDYKLVGLDVGVFFGDRKEFNKKHTICTWQSLEALEKRAKDFDTMSVKEFADGVVAVIVDECHVSRSNVLEQILTNYLVHVPIRWGLTGTIPKEEHFAQCLFSFIGPPVTKVSARELQDKDVLSDVNIEVLQFQDPILGFKSYQDELKWLVTDRKRLKALAEHIKETSKESNSFILVDRIECGTRLKEFLPDATFVSGTMKSKDRKEIYQEIDCSQNNITIATYGVAAVGISITHINNLYLFEPGKSFVRVIQSIGRGLRRGSGKEFVQVYDVSSTMKYSNKHRLKRKEFYEDAEYPYTLTKINY